MSNRCWSEQIGGECSGGALSQVTPGQHGWSFNTASVCSSVPLSVLSCILAVRVINKCPTGSALPVFGSLCETPGQQQQNFGWRLMFFRRISCMQMWKRVMWRRHWGMFGCVWHLSFSQVNWRGQCTKPTRVFECEFMLQEDASPVQGPHGLLPHHSDAEVSLGVTVRNRIYSKTQQQTGNIQIFFWLLAALNITSIYLIKCYSSTLRTGSRK